MGEPLSLGAFQLSVMLSSVLVETMGLEGLSGTPMFLEIVTVALLGLPTV